MNLVQVCSWNSTKSRLLQYINIFVFIFVFVFGWTSWMWWIFAWLTGCWGPAGSWDCICNCFLIAFVYFLVFIFLISFELVFVSIFVFLFVFSFVFVFVFFSTRPKTLALGNIIFDLDGPECLQDHWLWWRHGLHDARYASRVPSEHPSSPSLFFKKIQICLSKWKG